MTLEAKPLRAIRASSLAAALSDQVKIGDFTIVIGADGSFSIPVAGVLTQLGVAAAPDAFFSAFSVLTDSPATADALRDDINTNWAPKLAAIRTALISHGIIASS